jgi:hypothetical protein
MHSKSSSTPAALTTHQDPLDSESTNKGIHLRSRTVPPMPMATKISRFFINVTALLLDKSAGYKKQKKQERQPGD